MPKFSGPRKTSINRSPIQTTDEALLTYEGGVGFGRTPKAELFLLAVHNMVGENTFYESAAERDQRFRDLIEKVVQEDEGLDWVARFIPYLRDEMHLRSASLVMAAEVVRASESRGPELQAIVDSALQRADEPAEMLAYWLGRYGRKMPQAIRKGVIRGVYRLYNQHSALKYDGRSRSFRMGDVINLVHPKPRNDQESDLYKYLLDRRHHPDEAVPSERLGIIRGIHEWEKVGAPLPSESGKPLPEGLTWERLSGVREMNREAWQAVIPQMGYMALLRNLRNFDEADLPVEVKNVVAKRIRAKENVQKSRQLPFRFYSAWKAVAGLDWAPSLEEALGHSLDNVPNLSGRNLILVDISGSMIGGWGYDHRSSISLFEKAALFAGALAVKSEQADVYWFNHEYGRLEVPKGASILRFVDEVERYAGGGTNLRQALEANHNAHDRTFILTDEQAHDSTGVLPDAMIYTFNLAGYRPAHAPSSSKHVTFGGLSDAAFKMVKIHETFGEGKWPF